MSSKKIISIKTEIDICENPLPYHILPFIKDVSATYTFSLTYAPGGEHKWVNLTNYLKISTYREYETIKRGGFLYLQKKKKTIQENGLYTLKFTVRFAVDKYATPTCEDVEKCVADATQNFAKMSRLQPFITIAKNSRSSLNALQTQLYKELTLKKDLNSWEQELLASLTVILNSNFSEYEDFNS